jgi:hypothetical protein
VHGRRLIVRDYRDGERRTLATLTSAMAADHEAGRPWPVSSRARCLRWTARRRWGVEQLVDAYLVAAGEAVVAGQAGDPRFGVEDEYSEQQVSVGADRVTRRHGSDVAVDRGRRRGDLQLLTPGAG